MRTGGGGGGGQYDLVSASGDASLRLIYGGDVQPVNVKLIPELEGLPARVQVAGFNTVKGVHYGVSLQWGPNTLLYNTKKVKSCADELEDDLRPEIQEQGHGAGQSHPDRGRRALSQADEAEPGDQGPLRADQQAAARPSTLLKQQKSLVKKYWRSPDEINLFKSGDVVVGAGWPYQTQQLRAAKAPVKEIIPQAGTTGWADTWMLAKKAQAPELRLHVDEVRRRRPKVQAKQALVFGETPVNPRACPVLNRLESGARARNGT